MSGEAGESDSYTISTLIEELERLREQHGDLPIYVENEPYEDPLDPVFVSVERPYTSHGRVIRPRRVLIG